MLRFFSISCSLLAVIVVAVICFGGGGDVGGMHDPAAIPEDPAARAEQELLQMRDPATGAIPPGIRRAELEYAATLPQRAENVATKAAAAYTWQSRGPWNTGGRTRALAFDATNPNVLLAGGITGGMWRSTNRGHDWTRTTLRSQLASVTCLAQDRRPTRRHIWYYGTGEFRTNSTRFGNVGQVGDGIFRSIDSGKTWAQMPSTVSGTPQTIDSPFDLINAIVIDESNTAENEMYVAGYGAIMRSTDGGDTWRAVLGTPGSGTGFTSVVISRTGVLYAGFGNGATVEGIWRSTDGVTWANITPQTWSDSCRRIVLAIAPSDEKLVYVLAETPGLGLRVNGSYGPQEYYSLLKYTYRSGDGSGGGGWWSDRSVNLPQEGRTLTYNGLASYAMLLVVQPDDTNTVYLGGTNLYVSTDGFQSPGNMRWLGGYDAQGRYAYDGALHPDQHALVFDPLDFNRIFVGCDGGVYSTSDLAIAQPGFTSHNNGYVTAQFYSIAIDPAGGDVLLGGLQDNGSQTIGTLDPQGPWSLVFGGDGSFCSIEPGGGNYYVSAQGGYIVRFGLVADTFATASRVDPDSAGGYLFINPFALDPNDPDVMYVAGGRVMWRNDDLDGIPENNSERTSINWVRMRNTSSNLTISAIGLSTGNPAHRLYYGTTNGRVYRMERANEGQPTPVDVTGNNFPANGYVNCIAVDPADGDRALAVFTNYNTQSLFLTTDAGARWTAVGGNLEERPDGTGRGPSCRWAALVPRGDGALYAFVATTTGLYSTTELQGSATVWELEGPQTIGNVRVDMVAARTSDGLIAVATWGNGAFTATLPVSGVSHPQAVAGMKLVAIEPNPATSESVVKLVMPRAGRVVLDLFDLRGVRVATVLDDELDAGAHRVPLGLARPSAASLPGGAYVVRMRAFGASIDERLVLVR